jgi:uncharacterized coiled-coil protein SlyX
MGFLSSVAAGCVAVAAMLAALRLARRGQALADEVDGLRSRVRELAERLGAAERRARAAAEEDEDRPPPPGDDPSASGGPRTVH